MYVVRYSRGEKSAAKEETSQKENLCLAWLKELLFSMGVSPQKPLRPTNTPRRLATFKSCNYFTLRKSGDAKPV